MPEGRLIQALLAENKLWTKGTAAVPHRAEAVKGFGSALLDRLGVIRVLSIPS
jgi:hypothetical protein